MWKEAREVTEINISCQDIRFWFFSENGQFRAFKTDMLMLSAAEFHEAFWQGTIRIIHLKD
jgi:hypothetical protein